MVALKEPDMNLDAPAMPLGVSITPLKDEDGNFTLCSTVCVIASSMKECKNCKQITIFKGEEDGGTNIQDIL